MYALDGLKQSIIQDVTTIIIIIIIIIIGEAGDFFALADIALALFGFGALGFFVGPALFDFFAFEGDFGFDEAVAATALPVEEAAVVFFSAPTEAAFFAFATATLFFSAATFFAFGEDGFLPVFGAETADVFQCFFNF
ncbi:hypothetical protein TcasGA2_TC005047 [Tribolium castaneum]|uniref:Uncharacterized protein n=1 Tax=Tribolium castaneum TaxID=7070 RepID=D7GY69_TRICA|nr:hypothetical protein TcasGA2_TC005047 [Tribolium castaneum]